MKIVVTQSKFYSNRHKERFLNLQSRKGKLIQLIQVDNSEGWKMVLTFVGLVIALGIVGSIDVSLIKLGGF